MTERQDKYWICDACARTQGLLAPTWAVTCIKGLCGHCESPEEEFLTPVCDFSNPKTGRKAVWD
jgi:hypothetical protein